VSDDDVPAWRREFPVAWADDRLVTRRAFARALAGVSCASFAATAALAAARAVEGSAPVVELPGAAAMAVGASRVFDYPAAGRPCLLIRVGASAGPDGFVAFSQSCTHLGCPVVYHPEPGELRCPCHRGDFSAADGRVLRGPARRPLPGIRLALRDGRLAAVGWRA